MKRAWLAVGLCLALNVADARHVGMERPKATCYIFVLKDCPIANQYAPEMKRIVARYSPTIDFEMVFEDPGVSIRECMEHEKAYGYTVPVMNDPKHWMAKKYGVSVSPSVVLESSRVVYKGRIDNTYASISQRRSVGVKHDLREAIDAFLAGKPVRVPKTQAVGCRLF